MTLFTTLQNFVPQQSLSLLAGELAKSQNPLLKTALIRTFARVYDIRLDEYQRGGLGDYASFNDFFTRELKDGQRPVDQDADAIVCPADGVISQLGQIHAGRLLQAKGRHYDVGQLLADYELGKVFADGAFATIYLAPSNYHRVHMPFDGTLIATQYVPGTLFSVNHATAEGIPDLFARNERLICVFETAFGKACVVLVGAMIVAGIECVATGKITRTPYVVRRSHELALQKGDELGRFYLGSTAIVLLPPKAKVSWLDACHPKTAVKMGECLGRIG